MVGFSIGLMHVSVTNAGNGKARLKSYLDIITSVYKSAQVVASFVDLQIYSTDLQSCFPVDEFCGCRWSDPLCNKVCIFPQ